MRVAPKTLIVPLYLFACLIGGGSAQGVWSNMVLELIGIAIIAWSLIERPSEPMTNSARRLLWIASLALMWLALQLVPLPPSIWPNLGGRHFIADGYRDLGLPLPWQPISLAPYRSIDALLGAIPPLAVILGTVRLGANRNAFSAIAILAATVAGIGLSALQLSTGTDGISPWYLYPVTNFGAGVGFFANANHMASLLLIAVPFLAALIVAARRSSRERYTALVAIAAAIAILLIFGLALNGSLAGYGLILPVAIASIAIILPARHKLRRWGAALAIVLALVAVTAMAMRAISSPSVAADTDTSVQSRIEILRPTVDLALEFAPLGSGLATFRTLYSTAEDPGRVTTTYVIHAHNDLAEWALEGGVPALLILFAFLWWWMGASVAAWKRGDGAGYARAASVASGALILHSLVDFPLRTSALAAVFALCLALLADRRSVSPVEVNDLRPTRHIVIR